MDGQVIIVLASCFWYIEYVLKFNLGVVEGGRMYEESMCETRSFQEKIFKVFHQTLVGAQMKFLKPLLLGINVAK